VQSGWTSARGGQEGEAGPIEAVQDRADSKTGLGSAFQPASSPFSCCNLTAHHPPTTLAWSVSQRSCCLHQMTQPTRRQEHLPTRTAPLLAPRRGPSSAYSPDSPLKLTILAIHLAVIRLPTIPRLALPAREPFPRRRRIHPASTAALRPAQPAPAVRTAIIRPTSASAVLWPVRRSAEWAVPSSRRTGRLPSSGPGTPASPTARQDQRGRAPGLVPGGRLGQERIHLGD
jgi:hypothetical protein